MSVAFTESLFLPEGEDCWVGAADCCSRWEEVGLSPFRVKRMRWSVGWIVRFDQSWRLPQLARSKSSDQSWRLPRLVRFD